jgi:hypothetical protein
MAMPRASGLPATRKSCVCVQIRKTLFGDCTHTLLSPSGVSEET